MSAVQSRNETGVTVAIKITMLVHVYPLSNSSGTSTLVDAYVFDTHLHTYIYMIIMCNTVTTS